MRRRFPAAVAIGAGFLALTWLERKRPLRVQREPPLARTIRNLMFGAIALAGHRDPKPAKKRSSAVETIADIVLLDYTLWWWHRANHELPFLWRFHALHHRDRDLDASTAFRFHVAEQGLSSIYRVLQVRLIRPSEFSLWLWQTILFASILFHHSNVRLESDPKIARWVVTPRMHGIHHSDRIEDSHSNYASILSWWDDVHGTWRLDAEEVRIGLPVQPITTLNIETDPPSIPSTGKATFSPSCAAPNTYRSGR